MNSLTVFFHGCHAIFDVLSQLSEIDVHVHFYWGHKFRKHFFHHCSLFHVKLLIDIHLVKIMKLIFNSLKFSFLTYQILFKFSNLFFEFFHLFINFLEKHVLLFRWFWARFSNTSSTFITTFPVSRRWSSIYRIIHSIIFLSIVSIRRFIVIAFSWFLYYTLSCFWWILFFQFCLLCIRANICWRYWFYRDSSWTWWFGSINWVAF